LVAQQQTVRLHFLIVLTLVVAAFGVTRGLRTYRQTRGRANYVRALREYTKEIPLAEQQALQEIALAEHGRVRRDAAALLMQVRFLIQELEAPGRIGAQPPPTTSLEDIRSNFQRLRTGQPLIFPQGQPFLRGYYSALSDSFRPYGICVPNGYRGDSPMPLIITIFDQAHADPTQYQDTPLYQGAISVMPANPPGAGGDDQLEDSILALLADVRILYNIDKNRVYLVGHGTGVVDCYRIAGRYPHLFAGIVALGRSAAPPAIAMGEGPTEAGDNLASRLRRFLRRSRSPLTFAQNLEHCRVFAAHGTADPGFISDGPDSMVHQLRELGYTFWIEEFAIAKVFGAPPPQSPRSFTYTTASLRHNRAWWIQLDRLDAPATLSTVRATADDDGIRITTDNVSALSVLLTEAPVETHNISVDGTQFTLPARHEERMLRVAKSGQEWRLAQQRDLTKEKGRSGPVADVLRDPFIVVYGTQGEDEAHTRICLYEAERFAADWENHYGTRPRMKSDEEVSDADIADFNLFLFGGADVNGVTRRLAGKIPVRIDGEGVHVGDRTYSGDDIGAVLCYPNPLNQQRMVALVAGTTPAALFQAYDRSRLWLGPHDGVAWFDYAVFDSRTATPDSFTALGFYDNDWQLPQAKAASSGGGMSWTGDTVTRDRLLPQSFPVLARADEAEETAVVLSDVMPLTMDQAVGAVGFDRSAAGRPIRLGDRAFEKGLGIRAPSSLSFALGGRFDQFAATVGLTEGASHSQAPNGGVVFEVWGDGRQLASTVPLDPQAGSNDWTQLSVGVRGVDVLTLKAMPTDGTASPSGGAWGNPTVTR